MVYIYSQLEHKMNFTTETTNSDLNTRIKLIESDPNIDFCVCVCNKLIEINDLFLFYSSVFLDVVRGD